MLVARALELHVEGLEHVPLAGPAILVAHHYHHLYDAATILASVPREVHILIALDWLGTGIRLRMMRWLAAAARWPGVWRSGPGWRFNRDGYRQSLQVLREGRLLLVFPEGYPRIDPEGAREADLDGFRAFDGGFLVLARRAGVPVPIVPVGLCYAPGPRGSWTVRLRFGRPTHSPQLAALESMVHTLSAAPQRFSGDESSAGAGRTSPMTDQSIRR